MPQREGVAWARPWPSPGLVNLILSSCGIQKSLLGSGLGHPLVWLMTGTWHAGWATGISIHPCSPPPRPRQNPQGAFTIRLDLGNKESPLPTACSHRHCPVEWHSASLCSALYGYVCWLSISKVAHCHLGHRISSATSLLIPLSKFLSGACERRGGALSIWLASGK